jgi:hypothetical protein
MTWGVLWQHAKEKWLKLNEFRPYGMTNPPSTGTVIPVT